MKRAFAYVADNWIGILIAVFVTSFIAREIAAMWGYSP